MTPLRSPAPLRTAVMVSGSGRSLRNLLALESKGELPTKIGLVISSKAGVQAIQHAKDFDVPTKVLKPRETTEALEAFAPDLVIMAGYLRKWPIPSEFEGKTINIHPSLLPLFGGKGFYGQHVHKAVLESGMRVSGATVHYVTANFDEGPIIDQAAVRVHRDDTWELLAARVFEAELELLPKVIRELAERYNCQS